MTSSYKVITVAILTLSTSVALASSPEVTDFFGATPQLEETQSEVEVDTTPQVFGSVRAKFEQSTQNGDHRFNVRNSRLGVKGLVSEHMKYAMQIDFNNEGKVSILDSYVTYVDGAFSLTLGQQQYHFNADLDRGPSSSLFSNRSFLAKYLTTYYDPSANDVSTIGSRDIGALASYTFTTAVPVTIIAGLMNGSGANNPEWTDGANFTSRVAIGASTGFQVAASYYNGKTPLDQEIEMYGGELRYAGKNYLVESAIAQRQLQEDGLQTITVAHIHGYRKFALPKSSRIDHIAPHLRWDLGNGIEFENQESGLIDRYDAQRITVALNIGLSKKWIGSEIRLAYEEYIVGTSHSDANINPLLHDKYTIEFIASF